MLLAQFELFWFDCYIHYLLTTWFDEFQMQNCEFSRIFGSIGIGLSFLLLLNRLYISLFVIYGTVITRAKAFVSCFYKKSCKQKKTLTYGVLEFVKPCGDQIHIYSGTRQSFIWQKNRISWDYSMYFNLFLLSCLEKKNCTNLIKLHQVF